MTLPSVTATGNLGADPDLKFTPSGKAVASLSIGCNENKKNDAGQWETVSTTWLRISLWDDEAQSAVEHLRKGDQVTVTGQLVTREFDRNDGTKGLSVEVKYARVSKNLPRGARGERQAPQQDNAWGGQPQQQAADPWGGSGDSRPPF